ncbi:MAG: phosphate ABC transporter substrate-binding protein PstS [Pseudomonadota bacterium]
MSVFRKSLFISAMLIAGAAQADAVIISGAGASFPYPIYAKWAEAYNKATGVKLNYQSLGSGAGVKQIIAKTADFGASDDALPPEKLEESDLTQFPAVMGAVVPVVNIDGVKANELKLDQGALADIFLGKITRWNDPRISALNPGLKLPDKAISVMRRSDGSGTTAVFTNYLSAISPEWKEKVGEGKSVKWPVGIGGSKGSEDMSTLIKQIDGSIGYVEYAYAKKDKLASVQLKNKEGQFVSVSAKSTAAAAAHADWKGAKGFYLWITNAPGADSWPIAAQTNILLHKNPENCAQTVEVLKFFDWSWTNGVKMAEELEYVPLPPALINQIKASWKENIHCTKVAAIAG